MPLWFYRFPREMAAMCAVAAYSSMTYFNRRRKSFVAVINILWTNSVQDCLKEKATKIQDQSLDRLLLDMHRI